MLRVEAYERFKERLFSGELKPGQFVTQRELAGLIGVPLGPAREAIQRLEFESLVKVYPQRGIQVTDLSARLIREAYQFRAILEMGAIKQLATKANRAQIQVLMDQTQAILDRAKKGISAELRKEAVEVDWAMHDAIIAAANNSLYMEAYQINAARIRLIRASNVFSDERLVEVMKEHLAVLQACYGGKVGQATRDLEAHLNASRDRALRGV